MKSDTVMNVVLAGVIVVGLVIGHLVPMTEASFIDAEQSTNNVLRCWIGSSSNRIYAVAYTGPDADGFLKTVQVASDGQIADAVIDTLEFDTAQGNEPNMVLVSGNIFAIAYRGDRDDGFLKTVQIASNGQIGDVVIDTLEFDDANGWYPNIIHVAGNIFAIAYQGASDDGFLVTVQIASDGQIGNAVIDTLEFDTVVATTPNMVLVSGNVYAIAYWGNLGHGYLKTVQIATDGQIGDAVIDNLEFDTVMGYYPNIIPVAGSVYAISYEGAFGRGQLNTVEIASNGQMTDTVIDALQFDGVECLASNILHISGNIYTIAYPGANTDGFLKTVEIATNGQITEPVIDTLEFDTTDGFDPNIVPVSGNVYAIAYARGTGYLKTITIATDGQIADTVIDTLIFDAITGATPNIVYVADVP